MVGSKTWSAKGPAIAAANGVANCVSKNRVENTRPSTSGSTFDRQIARLQLRGNGEQNPQTNVVPILIAIDWVIANTIKPNCQIAVKINIPWILFLGRHQTRRVRPDERPTEGKKGSLPKDHQCQKRQAMIPKLLQCYHCELISWQAKLINWRC